MLRHAIVATVTRCTRYAWLVIILSTLAGAVSGVYAFRHFAINTDINTLISAQLPWRQREITFEKLLSCGFPTQEIIQVTAGEIRHLGYLIIRDPDECDASHVFAQAAQYKSRNAIGRDCKTLAEAVTRRWAESGT